MTLGNSYQENAYASSTAIAVPLLPPEKAWKGADSDIVIHCRDEHCSSALIKDNNEIPVCLQGKGLHKPRLPCVKGAPPQAVRDCKMVSCSKQSLSLAFARQLPLHKGAKDVGETFEPLIV